MKALLQPRDRCVGAFDCMTSGLVWSRDHDHWHAEGTCGFDLGIRGAATGILGDENFDPFAGEQSLFGCAVEGAARLQKAQVGRQALSVRRFDHAREIMMLWCGGEGLQLLAAETEEDSARLGAEGKSRIGRGRNDLPAIVGALRPGWAHERRKRSVGAGAGSDSIGRHLIGIRMRRIDHGIDALVSKVPGKSIAAAKAADAGRDGLRLGRGGAAGQRQRRVEPCVACDQSRKRGRFGGAAEDQNAKGFGHGC